MKKQIVVIPGGEAFENREQYLDFLKKYQIDFERYAGRKSGWKTWLREALPDYEVILPMMPNESYAVYEEWKIWMDKLIPFLNDEVILVGHSLGGSFLVKYLSENKFPKKIKGIFLVSALFDYDDYGYSLQTFSLPDTLDLQTDAIYLYQSKDDKVVPFRSLERFKKELPNAEVHIFEDRGHFNQQEFPELVECVRNLG